MEAMDMFTEKATIAITKPSTNSLGIKANGGAAAFGSLKKMVYQTLTFIHTQYTMCILDARYEKYIFINIVFIIRTNRIL